MFLVKCTTDSFGQYWTSFIINVACVNEHKNLKIIDKVIVTIIEVAGVIMRTLSPSLVALSEIIR